MLQAKTHSYVLYIIIMHTEGVAYNSDISNYTLTSFILRVVYCQSRKGRLAHTKGEIVLLVKTIMHVTVDPGTSAHLASHAATC